MRTTGMGRGRATALTVLIWSSLTAAALGEPVKTGGKGVNIPFSTFLDGDELHITTTGTASGTNPPPTIAEHVVTVKDSNIKTGSFTVPTQDKDPSGKSVNVRDYEIQVIHGGPDSYKSLLDVESFFPNGSDLNQNSVGDELSDRLGDDVALRLPIFSAGDGEFLYAMVNIAVYPTDIHFDIGQTFDIGSGTNPDLPGMVFGTSQILLDPSSPTGFDNPDPFSGTVTAVAENDPSAVVVPLPSVAWCGTVMMAGVAALQLGRRTSRPLARG